MLKVLGFRAKVCGWSRQGYRHQSVECREKVCNHKGLERVGKEALGLGV